MTKKQVERYQFLSEALSNLGFRYDEIDSLIKIERTLQRWGERECGDGSDWMIERDEKTDKPYNVYNGPNSEYGVRRYRIPDREKGALKRANEMAHLHGVLAFHQTDPRGCSLYILKHGDIPEGCEADSCYTRGIAVCID